MPLPRVWATGERGSLLKGQPLQGEEEREVVLWVGEGQGDRDGRPRVYPTRFLWDVFLAALFLGPCALAIFTATFSTLQPSALEAMVQRIWYNPWTTLFAPPFLGIVAVLGSVPRRVVREADKLAVEFLFHRRVVPISEVSELAVLDAGIHHFVHLLQRTETFPFGPVFRWFSGLPSNDSVTFVLITARNSHNFVFCLQDPIGFLVENQKPLDLRARYRTLGDVRVREGETLRTKLLGTVPRGRYLRVEQQRGRRVLVQFEDGKMRGWMSYINQLGRFLLAKEDKATVPAVGTVGASVFTGSYGTAIELSSGPQEVADE